MKKIISLLLALVMVMGLSVTAFAAENEATQTGVPTSSNAAITASYTDPSYDIKHTYKATIAWEQTGTIQYTSGTQKRYTWNTKDLVYVEGTQEITPVWTVDNAQVKITVTNYSDQKVTASCAEAAPLENSDVISIESNFVDNKSSVTVDSAAGASVTDTGAKKDGSVTLNITDVKGKITQAGQIGTVTVTLAIAG